MNEQDYNQQPQAPQAAAPPPPQLAPLPPAAPAPVPVVPVRRSPGLAVVLSCFPGLGHLYLGLYQRAVMVFLAFFIPVWLDHHGGDIGVLAAFAWFFALVDAYRQAQFLNAGMEPDGGAAATRTRKVRHGNLGFGVFLLIVGVVLLYNQFYPIDFSFLQDWWPLLLVLAGAYLMGSHFLEKQRQARSEAEAALPQADPGGRV